MREPEYASPSRALIQTVEGRERLSGLSTPGGVTITVHSDNGMLSVTVGEEEFSAWAGALLRGLGTWQVARLPARKDGAA